jgi:4-amino-4-deoxy-L-arabinose transferase-like glycosyltransferase
MVAKVKWLWREYNFFMIWALVIIVFFAFSHSILIPYLLPASLPLAVLVAACFEQVADQPLSSRKVLYGVTLGVFIALFAAFIAILTVRHIAITPMIWDMVVLFGVAIIFSVVAYFKRMTYHSFFWVVMIIFMAALDFLFLETANLQQRSVKQLVLYVKA